MFKLRSLALSFIILMSTAAFVHAGQITLSFAGRWTPVHASYPVLEKYMREYEELNPHIKFEYIGESGHTEYLEKLLVMSASVGLPDIVHLYNIWLPDFAINGMLTPLPSGLLDKLSQEVFPAALASTSYDGQFFGIPTENQVSALAYNKRILDENGIQPPQTWSDLAQDGLRVARFSPDGSLERAGLSFDGGGWSWTAHFITMLTGDGGTFIDQNGVVRFHEEQGLRVLERLVDWFRTTGFATNNTGMFVNGNGAFALAFPWWAFSMRNVFGDGFDDEFGITLIPTGNVRQTSFQYGWGFYVSSNSKYQAEAWAFLEWLARRIDQGNITPLGETLAALGSLPINRTDLQSPVFTANIDFYLGFIENLEHAIQEPQFPEGEQRQAIFGQEISAAVSGQKAPVQALNDAAHQIQTLLQSVEK